MRALDRATVGAALAALVVGALFLHQTEMRRTAALEAAAFRAAERASRALEEHGPDVPALAASEALVDLEREGWAVHVVTETPRERTLIPPAAPDLVRPARVPLRVEGERWHVAVAPREGWVSRQRIAAGAFLLLAFVLVTGASVHRIRREPDLLRDEVKRRRETLQHTHRELAQEALQREAAEEAARVKETFAAHVSHEIRTPMNGIVGMTHLLMDTELSEEQREYAEMIRNCGDTLLGLVDDILDFARLDAGRMELESVDFDVAALLDSLVDQFAAQASQRSVGFACDLAPEVPGRLRGDPGRLRQILTNLIGNALKFTTSGEVVLRVTVHAEASPPVLRFSVRDTGPGIAEDAVERIFEPFAQESSSTRRRHGGTGLGLAICREIAERMGGSIQVDSTPGRGSVFSLVAPFPPATGEGARLAPPAALAGLEVLVCDPEDTARRTACDLLARWGCRTQEVRSGRELLETLRRSAASGEPVGLALLATELSDLSGFDVAASIRDEELLAEARVVLVGAFGIRGDAARARETGCAGYLTKPLHSGRLLRVALGALSPDDDAPLATARSHGWERAGPARILVAEDNPVNQQVSQALLERRGHRVELCNDGRQALDALGKGSFDLVFMDVQMPGMDGLQAVSRIRKDPALAGLPVVAVTAYASRSDRERFLAAGFDGHLAKPFTPDSLDETLARHLAGSPAGEAPERGQEAPEGPSKEPERIDHKAALAHHFGDADLLARSRRVFREDAPNRFQALREAQATENMDTMMREGHRLTGSGRLLGASQLASLGEALEESARAGDLAAARSACQDLLAELERTCAALEGALPEESRATL